MGIEPQELKNKQVINFMVEDRFRLARHGALLIGFLALFFFG